jgi:DNA-binding CsgD family transcriptional regulator
VTAESNCLGDYLIDLTAASCAEECVTVTQRHVGKLGFENVVFAYTPRPRDIEGYLPGYLRYCTVSDAWEERYREMSYHNHCPLYRESLRGSALPFIWQDVRDRLELDAVQLQMFDEAAQAGVRNGISFAINERNGDSGGIGITTSQKNPEAGRITSIHLPQIFLMGNHLHAVIAERYLKQSNWENIPRLTVRELDCLYWVSIGKGTWEISEIHGISDNTVKFHLRNILAKLSVSTRAAAVAKAFRLGLLDF